MFRYLYMYIHTFEFFVEKLTLIYFLMIDSLFDLLTLTLVALGLLLKVPQVFHILQTKRAVGVSAKAILLELSSYTITIMYGFVNDHAFKTYWEYLIVLIQEYMLLGLVMHYQGYKPNTYISILVSFFAISFGLAFNIHNQSILSYLIHLATPLNAISKLMQLMEIFFKKDADSVNIFTWFGTLLVSATRMAVESLETAETNLMTNFLLSSFLNGAVTASAIYCEKLSTERKFK